MMRHRSSNCTRREFTAGLSALAGATLLRSARGAGERPPNVVLIISDDQGPADYGFMGHPTIRTPHLDRLATQSLLYTRGYVASPLCCPSLGAMLSGLHPHQNQIANNDPKMPAGPRNAEAYHQPDVLRQREQMFQLYRDGPMLPRTLGEHGYVSLQTGKWWGGAPSNAGFTSGMTQGDPLRGGRHGDLGLAIGRKTMQPIWDFLAGAGEQPFFLWYAPMLPHQPHDPPERLLARYQAGNESIHVARYQAMCEWFDETCGELLDQLDQRNLARHTLLLYLCDNGWTQRPDAPGHDAKSKLTSYEGGIRTPLMVRWPGHVEPQRDEHNVVSSVDLAPTVLHACGLGPDPRMQGLDLLDRPSVEARHAVCGATYFHDAADLADPLTSLRQRWVVEERWKLIEPYRTNLPNAESELYDLAADPGEEHNLAADQPDQIARLRGLLDNWWAV